MDLEEQAFLRSINNDEKSFVKFVNTTEHNVCLYWIDYQGQAVSYGVLAPKCSIDIDTFVTHPWIFVDEETRESFMVDQKEIFFPEGWSKKYSVRLRREHFPQRNERTWAFITLPMYTLREWSLRAIKRRLRYDQQAFKLEIPRSLQIELAEMLPRKSDNQEDS